jgi:hypothetical protein
MNAQEHKPSTVKREGYLVLISINILNTQQGIKADCQTM